MIEKIDEGFKEEMKIIVWRIIMNGIKRRRMIEIGESDECVDEIRKIGEFEKDENKNMRKGEVDENVLKEKNMNMKKIVEKDDYGIVRLKVKKGRK